MRLSIVWIVGFKIGKISAKLRAHSPFGRLAPRENNSLYSTYSYVPITPSCLALNIEVINSVLLYIQCPLDSIRRNHTYQCDDCEKMIGGIKDVIDPADDNITINQVCLFLVLDSYISSHLYQCLYFKY